jgi:hypothetical protein
LKLLVNDKKRVVRGEGEFSAMVNNCKGNASSGLNNPALEITIGEALASNLNDLAEDNGKENSREIIVRET